ncbi:MAG: hypothetical protein BZ138_05190 [Methanosphaera sp. rholeuAM270]|nr:MAG: hypothetical protein BZ138_05190 [Methanosphaera sp. rholeuAM270]
MKNYEQFSQMKVIQDIPLILRLDGRSFSKYTKQLKLEKPFDDRLRDIFIEVSKDLILEFNPKYVYLFSDEINIFFEEAPFNGRIEKIDSVIASFVSSSFMKHLLLNRDRFDVDLSTLKCASFDCRIVLTSKHVREYFKWRQDEAWRNCLNSYAQSVLNRNHSTRETSEILYKLKKQDIHELLYEHGINISHVPTWQKRGVCIHKITQQKEGVNPLTNTKNISNRKKIFVNLEMQLLN